VTYVNLPSHRAGVIDLRGMALHEIVLPETKPETEWVRGRALQKVSPTYDHARLQSLLVRALGTWADDHETGRVGTEWRFRIAPPGEIVRPLVPDVGYLSYEALPADTPHDAVQVPLGAPTVAVEILSPDDRTPDVEHKIATYLRAGTSAVIVVDPQRQTIVLHGDDVAVLRAGDVLTHPVLPGFSLDVGDLFERAKR
jgi:Uma2 family endonuclease